MRAVINPAYVKERIQLGEVLPLSGPYRITISASQICNFKCFYCTHSLDKNKVLETGFKFKNMEYEELISLADQLLEFPQRLKLIVFSGMGEPLLNEKLPNMIKYLKDNNVSDRVEMYSNASLLNKEITHKLIDAGLDSLKISLEGLSSEKYKKVCKCNVNFEEFKSNIKYFYENRGQCKVYIKIIDACLGEGEDKKFYEMFGSICDEIFIEHLSDCQPLTGDCEGIVNTTRTMYNEPAVVSRVCPLLFYSLYADADCNIYPCVTLGLPLSFSVGNFRNEKIIDMWNGEKVRRLRLQHLNGERNSISVCKECGNMTAMYHKEDDIDKYADKIKILMNDAE
ncbi:radical SAM/SPASM domain-containing protein [Heliorestis convoluta]|uniref:Radical SAM superfamily protein n=1 Tax=Heliorestis convoluta TaxID=356322 RepID=A0A5Q2N1M3_9FIRM|nr:radical SAM/SPASM domain-containing protein [Heliorestis convoluta]QGG48898.1 Radical SAM superfamily protein [Heliorestis convoluta]